MFTFQFLSSFHAIYVATALHFVVLSLGLLTLVASAPFNYNDQDVWRMFLGSQCGELRQSPINIVTAQANGNNALKPLTFHNYDMPLAGEFENIGTTVQFVPNAGATMAVSNHKGIYDLWRIYFHWGSTVTEGSEHQFDGTKHAAEIQFVHLKRNVPPGSTDPDAYAIVAVLAVRVTGPPASNSVWNHLSVPTVHATSNTVSGNRQYADLLPTNRDYYYYEGSFTTPLCTENVQWFVLQNTIPIPTGFLDDLRLVETESGTNPLLLTFNFRGLQDLNARSVFKFP